MSHILTQIMDIQREAVKKAKRSVSISDFNSFPAYEKDRRPFAKVLRGSDSISIIAEFKRASPSRGDISSDADVKDITSQYIHHGAAALSILTNEPFFKGHWKDIEKITFDCPIPILRKEFILDPWQITESRAAGADAVLLIMAALEVDQLVELLHASTEEGLEVLLECDHPSHLDTLTLLGDMIEVVGVNNRDLKTFQMDQNSGLQLLNRIPSSYVRVSESGHTCAEDIQKVQNAGIDAVLVGTTLMSSDNPGKELRNLLSNNE